MPDTEVVPPEPPICESCGAPVDASADLVHVRRVYVTPEAWDTEEKVEMGDAEWWCFVCRTHYPHQVPA